MVGVVSLGGAPHIGIVGLGHESGISFTPVPYPGGGGPLVTDLLGGHLPAAADGAFISLHKAGRARVLAVTTDERLPLIPDVPTFRESGMSAYRSFSFGLWAPAGTPAAIIKSIEAAIAEMKDDAALNSKLAEMGILLSPQGSDEFANSLRVEREALKPMVEASGYRED
jgi:tripartite-type tricarboxylate transporter receptor subunit TctC